MNTITPSLARTAPQYWEGNESLRQQLAEYKERTGASNQALGRQLGYPEGTAVSKYLSGKMDRDPADLEGRAADLLRMAARRAVIAPGTILDTSVIRQAHGFFDTVRRAGAVGVLHSSAGLGKTTAIASYLEANPTTIAIVANAAQADATGIRQLLWSATEHRGYSPCTSRWEYLVEKFRDSGRLLLVDNAQRIAGTGRDLLYDFRDATRVPMVLVGNPAILQRVAQSDQQHSRTLMEHECTLKTPEKIARQLVDLHTPHGEALYDLAEPVARRRGGGHLRALSMTLLAMHELLDCPGIDGDPRRAFESALAKSIHHKF